MQRLTYAYITKIQQLTNQAPFSFVLCRQTPGIVQLEFGKTIPSHAHGETSPQDLRPPLKSRLRTLKAKMTPIRKIATALHTRKLPPCTRNFNLVIK